MVNLDTEYFNQYRVQDPLVSKGFLGDNTCGLFAIPSPIKDRVLMVRASSDEGWDHVSVSVLRRSHKVAPVWPEMKWVKELFMGKDTWAVQYHPPENQNVSYAEVLHLWHPLGLDILTPPIEFV